jgi:hypothetical protein
MAYSCAIHADLCPFCQLRITRSRKSCEYPAIALSFLFSPQFSSFFTGYAVNISMPASLLFYATDADDEDFFDFLNASDLSTLGGLHDIQYLIGIAKEQAPHAGTEELLALVEQFLDQDGYLS